MKIIHLVLGKANPKRMNGVNKVACKLATVQADMAYDVCLWGISNELDHNYPARNFSTHLFQQHRQKFTLDPLLIEAINELPKETVFHIHGAFIPEFYLVGRQLSRRSIPYIITPHGSLAKAAMQQSFIRKKIYFQFFEKGLLRRARAVHVLGKSGFDHLGQLLPECHRVIIPNGQDLNELPMADRQANPNIHFVFCGRLDIAHKGLDLLLKGFGKYKKNGGGGSLGIIGGGADSDALKQIAKEEEITESLIFYGPRFGAEKWDLLNRGDAFVHTSRMEGFPIAVVEAAGLGLPCIVSEATNIADYIRQYNAGIALGKNNPQEIAKAMMDMEKMQKEKTLKKWGLNARRMIATSFDWKEIAKSLYQVYVGSSKENIQKEKTMKAYKLN